MDNQTRSYFIYFGLLIGCFLLAGRAEKTNNKIYIFIIAFVLSYFSGYRKQTVGIDTQNYYWIFGTLTNLASANKYNDPYFYKIAYILMKIDNDPYFPLLVFAFISNFLVIYRLWDFRKYASYKYAVLRYISVFYFFSFNCVRQFLAIAIVFWATKYLERGNYRKYILIVIAASFIHLAALTAISLVTMDYFKWENLDKTGRNYVKFSILCLPAYLIASMIASRGRIDSYMSFASFVDNYISIIFKIVLFVVVVILTLNEHNVLDTKEQNELENQRRLTLVYYFIGLLITILGYIYAHLERIGYFFYIYSTVYLGIIANEKKYKTLFRIVILIIIIRAFYMNCAGAEHGSMGQMPYLFNWE